MSAQSRKILSTAAQLAIVVGCLAWYYSLGRTPDVEPIEVHHGPAGDLKTWDGLREYSNLDELQRVSRPGLSLSRTVDFSRHKLVRLGWSDTGPLNAYLTWNAYWGGRQLVFRIAESPASHATFLKMLYEDWYIVPRETQVRFIGRRGMTDAGINLTCLSLAALVGMFVVARQRRKESRRAITAPVATVERTSDL